MLIKREQLEAGKNIQSEILELVLVLAHVVYLLLCHFFLRVFLQDAVANWAVISAL